MQRLSFLLFQIDEACRYLLDGRLQQLRLALLLLDNAAEFQMEHRIEQELGHEDVQERIRARVLELPAIPERHGALRDLVEWQPLTTKKREKIERYFDDKVHALSNRWDCLQAHLVEPLKHLHKYRNEAYHRGRVRRGTIHTAGKLLLDINCEMLLSLYPRCMVCSSDEDYSWLQERFGDEPMRTMGSDAFVQRVVDEFRSTSSLSDATVASGLAEHIESRLQEFFDALDFIVENTRCPDRQVAFNDSQYFNGVRQKTIDPALTRIDTYRAELGLEFVEGQIAKKVPSIRAAANRLEAFRRFSVIESQFEPLEESVSDLAAEVDHMIQMQIDRSRGK